MSAPRKTLSPRAADGATPPPALQRKGRGWQVATSRLDTLHDAAREARRNPSPAHEALAAALIAAELGKYRLKRQVVIGSAIVDFACQPLKVAVQIDAGGDPALLHRSDRALEAVGIALLRFAAERVLAETEMVVAEIVATLKLRWAQQRQRPQHSARGYGR